MRTNHQKIWSLRWSRREGEGLTGRRARLSEFLMRAINQYANKINLGIPEEIYIHI